MAAAAPSTDIVQRFLFEELDIRGAIVRLSNAWQRMCERRDYPPCVERLLGEATAVGVLIAGNLKQPGRLTVQMQGHGPVSMLVIDCSADLHIRGMARHAAGTPEAPVADLIGNGRLAITVQTERAPRPYQSLVPLEGETLAEIFEHFLAQSEQQPARLRLAAGSEQACGLFLQRLPGALARDPDGWNRIERLAATLGDAELAGVPVGTLLTRLFPGETIRLFDPRPVVYECPQDWNKVRSVLRSLGREELESILREHGRIHVRDDICNHEYSFSAADVEAILAGGQAVGPPTLH